MSGLSEDEKKILSKIGKKVHFKYPMEEPHVDGVLKDRCLMREPSWPGTADVPYWSVVDLIEFTAPNGEIFEALRFGYYRKKGKRLTWASQTTLTESWDTYKALFVKAAREKPWFRKFLEAALKEADAQK